MVGRRAVSGSRFLILTTRDVHAETKQFSCSINMKVLFLIIIEVIYDERLDHVNECASM